MKASDNLLQLFPIKNKNWHELLLRYLQDNEELCQNILNAVEPVIDDILPNKTNVFRALSYFNPDQVRVVILGQDPYPNKDDACGLSFSTEHSKTPGSLRNIFKEIQADFGGSLRTNNNLSDWAKQGVLLLNATLTVLPHKSNCHSNIGWQQITNFILKTAWDRSPHSIFLLWGRFAQQTMSEFSSESRILKCGHPSPLAYGKKGLNNFKGCGHFKKANQYLVSNGLLPIAWNKNDSILDFIIQ